MGRTLCPVITRSLPSRGAWIEIASPPPCSGGRPPSLPSRGAWIEIRSDSSHTLVGVSLPSRGAWIEISCQTKYRVDLSRRSPRGERG